MKYALVGPGVGIGVWLVGFHVTRPVFILPAVGMGTGRWLVGAILSVVVFAFTYVALAKTLHFVFPATVLRKIMIANGWS